MAVKRVLIVLNHGKPHAWNYYDVLGTKLGWSGDGLSAPPSRDAARTTTRRRGRRPR